MRNSRFSETFCWFNWGQLIFGVFWMPQPPELEAPQPFPVPCQLSGGCDMVWEDRTVFFPWILGFLGPEPFPGSCSQAGAVPWHVGAALSFCLSSPIPCAEISSTWEQIFKGLNSSDVFEIGCKGAPWLAAGISGRQPTAFFGCAFKKKILKDNASINWKIRNSWKGSSGKGLRGFFVSPVQTDAGAPLLWGCHCLPRESDSMKKILWLVLVRREGTKVRNITEDHWLWRVFCYF